MIIFNFIYGITNPRLNRNFVYNNAFCKENINTYVHI